MNNFKNRWYNRIIIRYFFRKELKKKSLKQLNQLYFDLIHLKYDKSGHISTNYPQWQVDIAIKEVIRERAKRDKSK